MSVFRFSLEQVLRYRKQLEERAMQVLARAVQARDRRLREKEDYEAAVLQARQRLAAVLDADELWLVTGYVTALTQDIERARADLAVLEENVDRSRADLTQRTQDRKLLERLKEKQATRHTQAENYKEQQSYDDTATIRFVPPAI